MAPPFSAALTFGTCFVNQGLTELAGNAGRFIKDNRLSAFRRLNEIDRYSAAAAFVDRTRIQCANNSLTLAQ